MSAAIVHFPCGCRMAVRGAVVTRWQACEKGHPGKLAHDIYRKIPGRAHTLGEREKCADPKCQDEMRRVIGFKKLLEERDPKVLRAIAAVMKGGRE